MKRSLSERDICTKFITPAVKQAGWDVLSQIREEVSFTKGRIIVRGKLVTRGKAKRADYILYYKPNIPIALIEAKDNNYAVGDGMQQALEYAATLDIPFVFSSNGDAFLFHDRTGQSSQTETEFPLSAFPAPDNLWAKYREWKGLSPEQEEVFLQDYFEDNGGKEPRYYLNLTVAAARDLIERAMRETRDESVAKYVNCRCDIEKKAGTFGRVNLGELANQAPREYDRNQQRYCHSKTVMSKVRELFRASKGLNLRVEGRSDHIASPPLTVIASRAFGQSGRRLNRRVSPRRP